MIERYEVEEISTIWSSENRFRKWLDVELAITEVWYEWGEVPEESFRNIKEKANFNVNRIDEIEKKVKHDVIAFLTSVEEFVGKDSAYIHKGITAYDIVDTALSLLIRESLDIIIDKTNTLKNILIKKAFQYKDLLAIGRTHGIHAEPITFGVKYLVWYEEIKRNLQRLHRAKEIIALVHFQYVAIAGSVVDRVYISVHLCPHRERGAAALRRAMIVSPTAGQHKKFIRSQRLGNIANTHLNHFFVRICFNKFALSSPNFREKITRLKFQVIFINDCHICLFYFDFQFEL